MLTRAEIERRVPHAGSMCLLDQVVQWDTNHIVCQAESPRMDHPLALAAGVPVVAAVEYAAQAAALHGALLDGSPEPRGGRLARLSGVELTDGCLDAGSGRLTIRADLLARSDAGCTYNFAVHDACGCRASGRLLVAFGHDG
jgi:predicted hotdog family 3-hydroxylacyl-ACP dehydratase